MKINNLEKSYGRISNIDFLRGIVIILALQQHFAFYLNFWFVEYFRDSYALSGSLEHVAHLLTQQIPTDSINAFFSKVFTPWVSQIYLTLAAFNLAMRDQVEFKKVFSGKMKVFSLIFIFFLMENLIVAPNSGLAISIYPIMLWMFVLTTLSIVFKKWGIKGIYILTLISFFRFIIPIEVISNFIEFLMQSFIHPSFEYDAKLEYFILSGCLGFLMGYVYFQKEEMRKYLYQCGIIFGIIFMILGHMFGPTYEFDKLNVLSAEHLLAKTFFGTLYILGAQSLVINIFLWLDSKNIKFRNKLVNWVGENSIIVFGFHRILMTKIIIPMGFLLGGLVGWRFHNTFIEAYAAIGVVILVCYYLKKSEIDKIIFNRRS